ncbi:hypothetical protein [Xenorhabdus thuongxuanensis]|uniref:Uncharacterized protein n=1 Tax=Xenorhabdus thuongxuanensis TaxID=1873484 RepID=A0A1Q5U9C8_9GAMM|nr:hypothetical protein [Xenorhabdus thuongxuanensis]OKP09071.1 hypothetical protein Xentx_00157 [Xenorhabdus thuongxuanensis]
MNNWQDNDKLAKDCKDDDPTWHGVIELKIKLPQISREARIFANGKNRVAIDIYIQATNCNNKTILVPRDLLLQHVWLVDYDTQEKLLWNAREGDNFTWSYIDIPNEFTNTPKIPSLINKEENNGDNNINLSRITYYVYCSPAAVDKTKQIAVLVTTQTGKTATTAFGVSATFDSFVQLTSMPEMHYKLSDIHWHTKTIQTKYADIEGHHMVSWNQDNTYVKLNRGDRYIVALSWSGNNPLTGDNIPSNCIHQRYHADFDDVLPDSGYYCVHFIWALGGKTNVAIGNTTWWEVPVKYEINIDIRQEGDKAICFTVMKVWVERHPMLHDTWFGDFTVYFYDQYGNKGIFGIVPNNNNDEEKNKDHFIDVEE